MIMDIQSQIDELFSPIPEVVEETFPEVVKEEKKRKEYERVSIDEDIFSNVTGVDLQELTETVEQIQEKIDIKKADMGEVIKDFRKSDAPQFKGKSKKKKQQMAIAAKLQAEEPKKVQKEQYTSYEERLMGTVLQQISNHSRPRGELKEVPQLNEERFRNLEVQLLQVKQLFHEATMVSGIGQGGDGQTPGSGEVNIMRMDDVYAPNGIAQGQGLIWDATINKFVPGAANNDGAVMFAVDRLLPGDGIDLDPPLGVGTVTIHVDLALEELRNVNGTPTTGDLLIYDGTNWNVGTLTDEDIAINTPSDINDAANILTQSGANAYFGTTLENHEERIDILENATKPGTFLGAIDVTDAANEPDTSKLNPGDYYIHEGTTGLLWGVGDDVDNGNQVIWDGENWLIVSTVSTLAQLGDTDVDSAISGDLLVYNDNTDIWESQTVPIPTVTIGAIEPNTGNEKDGDFWFDNANGVLYIYDSIWTVAGGGGASVAISALPPVDPVPEEGNLWVSNDDWTLHVFDGSTWIALTNNGLVGGGGASGDYLPLTGGTIDGNLKITSLANAGAGAVAATTDGTLYVYQDTALPSVTVYHYEYFYKTSGADVDLSAAELVFYQIAFDTDSDFNQTVTHEIDLQGDGTWVDANTLKNTLGLLNVSTTQVVMYGPANGSYSGNDPVTTYPNLRIRTTIIDGPETNNPATEVTGDIAWFDGNTGRTQVNPEPGGFTDLNRYETVDVVQQRFSKLKSNLYDAVNSSTDYDSLKSALLTALQ